MIGFMDLIEIRWTSLDNWGFAEISEGEMQWEKQKKKKKRLTAVIL
jgi:hypothetical protein